MVSTLDCWRGVEHLILRKRPPFFWGLGFGFHGLGLLCVERFKRRVQEHPDNLSKSTGNRI